MTTQWRSRTRLFLMLLPLVIGILLTGTAAAALPEPAELQRWIQDMKESPKGPFQGIRWFCADGTVQPPKAYACAERGGGIQHGLRTDRAERLRDGGYVIASLLADLDASDFAGEAADLDSLKQILIERFLIQADDGWIFRGARSYRGAFQIEDEAAAAGATLLAMARDPAWRGAARFMLFREAVRLFPRKADSTSATEVRQLAIVIANKDTGFAALRAKIHNAPDASDAQRVREYAASAGKSTVDGGDGRD